MRAQVLTRFDGPAGFALDDVPPPALVRDDDVRIRIEACGVCHRDITFSRGLFGGGLLPAILGHEGAGTVLEVGSAVTDLGPGDRVAHLQFPSCGTCEACASGRPQLCRAVRGTVGEVRPGAFAEQLVLPRRLLVRVPEAVAIEAAAIAACAIGTSLHALRLYGFSPAGRWVAITGAAGGVGIHAVQVAKALGARVIAITSTQSKADAVRAVGADEVVVSPDGSFRRGVLRATGRQGADLVLEIVGAPTLRESLLALAPGGRVVLVGNPLGGTCELNPALLILRGELQMYGALAVTGPELEEVLDMVAQGAIRPIIDRVADLADLPAEMERMASRSTIGRVVARP